MILQIFLNGGNPFIQHPEKSDSRSFQLIFRLDKIASVRPKARFITAYHKRPVGSGKTGKIFPHLKISIHIFRIVEIRGGHHIIIDPRPFHSFPELGYTIPDCLVHIFSPLHLLLDSEESPFNNLRLPPLSEVPLRRKCRSCRSLPPGTFPNPLCSSLLRLP